jgi:hypothetical protein
VTKNKYKIKFKNSYITEDITIKRVIQSSSTIPKDVVGEIIWS